MNRKSLCAIAFGLFFAATSASATIISNDWKSSNDNLLTFDSATNLQWLDLTQTFNQTVTSVLSQTGTGGTFASFRLASASEVHTLMADAGIPFANTTGTISSTVAQRAAATALTNLLGNTLGPQYGTSYFGSRGHLSDSGSDLVVGFYQISGSSLFNDYFSGQPTWQGAGVWLVREATPVPEPTSVALLGLGLVGFAASRRKSAKSKNA